MKYIITMTSKILRAIAAKLYNLTDLLPIDIKKNNDWQICVIRYGVTVYHLQISLCLYNQTSNLYLKISIFLPKKLLN